MTTRAAMVEAVRREARLAGRMAKDPGPFANMPGSMREHAAALTAAAEALVAEAWRGEYPADAMAALFGLALANGGSLRVKMNDIRELHPMATIEIIKDERDDSVLLVLHNSAPPPPEAG